MLAVPSTPDRLDSHLLAPNTSTGPQRKWIASTQLVDRIVFVQPSLGLEGIGIVEVSFTVSGGPHTHRDRGLEQPR